MTAPETVIERCARAIDDCDSMLFSDGGVDARELARAVLLALREPSEGMIEVLNEVVVADGRCKGVDVFRAGIDFALAEKG